MNMTIGINKVMPYKSSEIHGIIVFSFLSLSHHNIAETIVTEPRIGISMTASIIARRPDWSKKEEGRSPMDVANIQLEINNNQNTTPIAVNISGILFSRKAIRNFMSGGYQVETSDSICTRILYV